VHSTTLVLSMCTVHCCNQFRFANCIINLHDDDDDDDDDDDGDDATERRIHRQCIPQPSHVLPVSRYGSVSGSLIRIATKI